MQPLGGRTLPCVPSESCQRSNHREVALESSRGYNVSQKSMWTLGLKRQTKTKTFSEAVRWLGVGVGVQLRYKPDRKDTHISGEPHLGLTRTCFAYELSIWKAETQVGMGGGVGSKVQVSVL